MKRMAVLGGVVIALIAVIKIGSIFVIPSGKSPTEGKTSTEETYQTLPAAKNTSKARETVTIEIENGGGNLASDGSDPAETLPTETTEGQSNLTADTTKAAASGTSATTRAAANFTVTAMDSKTMYAIKSVRVRESASTDSAVVGGLTPGQDVKATGTTSNGWIQVSYDGKTAYVSKSYLSTNKADVVKETTAARKSNSDSSNTTNATKSTKAQKETTTAAPTPTTAAGSEETIAPFPG